MKKLLLLLILSLFSIQSYAGSCPDGTEPVKSISADGTNNDGEISGIWGFGNRIKIELVKK